ncbi:MAG TPA: glycosyltransferase family 4 protein [Nitrospira sp.]|nr:glycosyltransferase family 4 protein [Nitrospira sp.]
MARRVLYIHGIGEIGGAERDLLAMLGMLDRAEWEPHVACPSEGPFQSVIRQAGISAHPLALTPWRKWYSLFVRWRGVARLRALLTQLQPALVHVNDIWWVPHTIEALGEAPVRRIPLVAHVRQEIEPDKVRRYGLDRVDSVIAISRQVEEALAAGGVAAGRLQTIYSGLDYSPPPRADDVRESICRTLGLPADAVLLGTVANVFPRKGYDIMIRALPGILEAVPTAHYLIVGTEETGYAGSLLTLARKLRVLDHVHMVGFQDPVRPYLASLDLYVHPALLEGFGIAVVEAMAAGKAVVATRTGGLPEVVEHERTGLLVAPGDPDQLSAAILSLLRDATRREQMGSRGAARVRKQFDLKASVAAIEQLYRTVLGTPRTR